MPEGHTIRRLARDQRALLGGTEVAASSPQGRFTVGAQIINGRLLRSTDAWGKHLFHDYGDGLLLHVHLGLYGTFKHGPGAPPEPRGAIRLRLVGPKGWADLRGATTCEILDPLSHEKLLLRLGPDPLRGDADVAAVRDRIGKSRAPIGGLLMDQSVIAGVGNAFRAEVLFRHQIDPYLPGRELGPGTLDAIWTDLVELLQAGVRTNRIITTRPEDRLKARGPVTRRDQYYVYGRAGEPCRLCDTAIATSDFRGRWLYWCPNCQPEGAGSTPRE